MTPTRRSGLALALGLLLASALGSGCPEEPKKTLEQRRAEIEAATAMEPIPGAPSGSTPSAAAPAPENDAAAELEELPEGEVPPVKVFSKLLVQVSSQGSTIAGFVDVMRNRIGGCEARLQRGTSYLSKANDRSRKDADRFFALLPRYSGAQQKEATRAAIPAFKKAMARNQRAGNEMVEVLLQFRRSCPGQVSRLQGAIIDHTAVLQDHQARIRESGITPG